MIKRKYKHRWTPHYGWPQLHLKSKKQVKVDKSAWRSISLFLNTKLWPMNAYFNFSLSSRSWNTHSHKTVNTFPPKTPDGASPHGVWSRAPRPAPGLLQSTTSHFPHFHQTSWDTSAHRLLLNPDLSDAAVPFTNHSTTQAARSEIQSSPVQCPPWGLCPKYREYVQVGAHEWL